MERLVWDKVRQFLELLRCEDVDRESIVDTKEFQEARKALLDKNAIYQQSLADIQQPEQEKIKDYVEALKSYSFEECQQAYLQGMTDCMLVLYGAGVLKPKQELEVLLKTLLQPLN